MSARCLLCDAAAPPRFCVAGYAIHRCDACDLEFVWPTPAADALARVYASGYFTGGGAGYTDYIGRERAQAVEKSRVRLDAIASLGITAGRLLDVGCAAGYFMASALARGFDVRGVEPSPEAREALSPSLVEKVDASIAEAAHHRPYDVITLWDVLEHLPDPTETLRSARALASPGGVVAVVTPVIGNVNTRWIPRSWDQYKPPEHLWYFSRRSLRALITREIGPVLLDEVAWSRPGRFYDPESLRSGVVHRALRSVDRSVGRVLASALGPDALVDAVACYARVR